MNKSQRNLLIAMAIGDGTISNNYVFKMAHGQNQLDYLKYKVDLLNKYHIKNSGIKTYIQSKGYAVGTTVYYTQLSIKPFIKLLRRILYIPQKRFVNIKLLKRLDAQGLAIWYMDDGHLNMRYTKDKQRIIGFYIKISTCFRTKEEAEIVINYFKDYWDINFYTFMEKGKFYSLCCGTQEGKKFIEIIKDYIPDCMKYKIHFDKQHSTSKWMEMGSTLPELDNQVDEGNDIVCSAQKCVAGFNSADDITNHREHKVRY